MKNQQIYIDAINYFGRKNQLTKTIEECSELICILARLTDRSISNREIITEIADVQIMIDQLKIIYGEKEVENEINYKLDRLKLRIKHKK